MRHTQQIKQRMRRRTRAWAARRRKSRCRAAQLLPLSIRSLVSINSLIRAGRHSGPGWRRRAAGRPAAQRDATGGRAGQIHWGAGSARLFGRAQAAFYGHPAVTCEKSSLLSAPAPRYGPPLRARQDIGRLIGELVREIGSRPRVVRVWRAARAPSPRFKLVPRPAARCERQFCTSDSCVRHQ